MPTMLESVGININLNEVGEQSGFDPVPAGSYEVLIYSIGGPNCDAKGFTPTRDGSGRYVAASFEIASGNFKGRRLFHNFNLVNNSQKAKTIAVEMFVRLLRAVGFPLDSRPGGPDSPAELMQYRSIPLIADVRIADSKGGQGPRNEIAKFRKKPGAPAYGGSSAPWTQQPAAMPPAPDPAVINPFRK